MIGESDLPNMLPLIEYQVYNLRLIVYDLRSSKAIARLHYPIALSSSTLLSWDLAP